jgi:hypothetical protein
LGIHRQGLRDENARTVEYPSIVGNEEVNDRQLKDPDIHGAWTRGPQDPVDGSFSTGDSPSIGRDGGFQTSAGAHDAHTGESTG